MAFQLVPAIPAAYVIGGATRWSSMFFEENDGFFKTPICHNWGASFWQFG
jgi:hypothetical protein